MSKTVSDITELITTYYPKVRKIFRDLVSIKDIPISMTQLTCLTIIDKQGKLTMTDLAEELSMSNQQLTKVVDALSEFGMIERTFDETNRRKVFAEITPKGKERLVSLNAEIERKMGYIIRKFSEDEMDKLYACLAHIAGYFGYKE